MVTYPPYTPTPLEIDVMLDEGNYWKVDGFTNNAERNIIGLFWRETLSNYFPVFWHSFAISREITIPTD